MKEEFQTLVLSDLDQFEPKNQQVVLMGGVLVLLNVVLMVFVGLYWTNPIMHQYISGKPL